MVTAHSPAARIRRSLEVHGIPQETFCEIVGGVSTGTMSGFLNGGPISDTRSKYWLETTRVIDAFIKRLEGIPVNWHPRCAPVLKKKLHDFEHRLLLISVVSLTPEADTPEQIARAASSLQAAFDALASKLPEPPPEET